MQSGSVQLPRMQNSLRRESLMQLRYMGFDQTQNIRVYRFDSVAKGEPVGHFVVSADLVLFQKHHVAIQEGPTLSMQRLAVDLEGLSPSLHQLTESDFLDFVSARSLAQSRKTGPRNFKRSVKTAATA
jgi:hypothetical protein